MTLEEAGRQIDAAVRAYGDAAIGIIERILEQVKSESGQEAVNTLIEEHDLDLRYNMAPNEFDFGSD
jgi:hypothetical protein